MHTARNSFYREICRKNRNNPGNWGVEDKDVVPYESRIEEVILCHWNRDYPADMYFKMALGSWKLAETQEYAGSSHEKITEERYVRR